VDCTAAAEPSGGTCPGESGESEDAESGCATAWHAIPFTTVSLAKMKFPDAAISRHFICASADCCCPIAAPEVNKTAANKLAAALMAFPPTTECRNETPMEMLRSYQFSRAVFGAFLR
jgi:hypothetical protein